MGGRRVAAAGRVLQRGVRAGTPATRRNAATRWCHTASVVCLIRIACRFRVVADRRGRVGAAGERQGRRRRVVPGLPHPVRISGLLCLPACVVFDLWLCGLSFITSMHGSWNRKPDFIIRTPREEIDSRSCFRSKAFFFSRSSNVICYRLEEKLQDVLLFEKLFAKHLLIKLMKRLEWKQFRTI